MMRLEQDQIGFKSGGEKNFFHTFRLSTLEICSQSVPKLVEEKCMNKTRKSFKPLLIICMDAFLRCDLSMSASGQLCRLFSQTYVVQDETLMTLNVTTFSRTLSSICIFQIFAQCNLLHFVIESSRRLMINIYNGLLWASIVVLHSHLFSSEFHSLLKSNINSF